MAIAQAAAAAASAATKYAPQVYNAGMSLVAKATSGRVTEAKDIVPFVKGDARKLSVITGALAAGGMSANDLIPSDLAALNPQLTQIRATIEGIASNMRDRFDAGSDRTVGADESDTAKDLLRKQRVNAALDVYGSAEKYFLCHPNGGIPRSDFSWFKTMGFRR